LSAFELSKWYADTVTDQGDAAILYQAELRLGGLPIPYQSLLLKQGTGPTSVQSSLRRTPPPSVTAESIYWHSSEWQSTGLWNNLGVAHHENLFESPSGSLEWSCLAPRAAASLQIGSPATHLQGWGYVEHLRLTIPPWRLPIRRLRWGRFLNAIDALLWIDWTGPYNKQVVYFNGTPIPAQSITDDEIVLASATLHLDEKQILRDGLLGATALSIFSKLGDLFPTSVLNMRECKWLTRATLRRPGLPDSTGFAIHEVVEWP